MKTKTIIASDPDERAVIAVETAADGESVRVDKIAFEWRGPGSLKPFRVEFDLRGLPESIRTSTLDVPRAVAATFRDAALELDAETAKQEKRNERR